MIVLVPGFRISSTIPLKIQKFSNDPQPRIQNNYLHEKKKRKIPQIHSRIAARKRLYIYKASMDTQWKHAITTGRAFRLLVSPFSDRCIASNRFVSHPFDPRLIYALPSARILFETLSLLPPPSQIHRLFPASLITRPVFSMLERTIEARGKERIKIDELMERERERRLYNPQTSTVVDR